MANITVTGRIYNAPQGINMMGYWTQGGTPYTANVTAGQGYYTYSISVPENTRLAPRVRTDAGWQGACAPTYLVAGDDIDMDIQCSDCYSPPVPSGGGHTVYGNARDLPINGTKLQFRDRQCECDDEECEDDYWFKTATIWADDYEFNVLLPGNSTYSVYHWREKNGTKQWVPCVSPTNITVQGQTGMLCLTVRATGRTDPCG